MQLYLDTFVYIQPISGGPEPLTQLLNISYIGKIKDTRTNFLQISVHVQSFRLKSAKFQANPCIVADMAPIWRY